MYLTVAPKINSTRDLYWIKLLCAVESDWNPKKRLERDPIWALCTWVKSDLHCGAREWGTEYEWKTP